MTHFTFSDAQKELMTKSIKEWAKILGVTTRGDHISFPSLLKEGGYSHECLSIGKGDAQTYIEFPIVSNGELSEFLHDKIIAYYLRKLWRIERNKKFSLGQNKNADEYLTHYDATINSIWCHRLLRITGESAKVKFQTEIAKNETWMCRATFVSSRITVNEDRIILSMPIPESIAAQSMMTVAQIIDLPDCGDPIVQEKFNQQYIWNIEKDGNNTILRTMGIKEPVIEHESSMMWRAILQMERDFHPLPVSYDPVRYDPLEDARRTRKELEQIYEKYGCSFSFGKMPRAA